jgi:hypothetical protein
MEEVGMLLSRGNAATKVDLMKALRWMRDQYQELGKTAQPPKAAEGTEQLFDEAVKVIKFYSDPETYFAVAFLADDPAGDFMEDFSPVEDYHGKPGKRAREFLDKLESQETVLDSAMSR